MSSPRRISANLDQLADAARQRVAAATAVRDREAMAALARETLQRDPRRDFLAAVAGGRSGRQPRLIAEVKRGSPAAGTFGLGVDAAAQAERYAAGGAAAVSVVTESGHFRGDPGDLARVRAAVPLPVLQKDFIVDPYQVYEAVVLGADAILLIAAILTPEELGDLLALARQLDLAALVEVNTPAETEAALAVGARLIGINNRNLRTFAVDLATTEELVPLIPPSVTVVGASGVRSVADAARVAAAGVDALLVGESLVRSGDPTGMVRTLLEAAAAASRLWVKICGITDEEGARAAVNARADAVGFVFAESPRRTDPAAAGAIAAQLPAHVARVGVFVDAPAGHILTAARQVGLTHVQFHGRNGHAQLAAAAAAGLITIQAVRVKDEASLKAAWDSPADLILLDAYSPTKAGGTGQTFPWSWAVELAAHRPVVLAGGLAPENVADAVRTVGSWGVDVASGVEQAPGRKDPPRVAAFVRTARLAAAAGRGDSNGRESVHP